MDTQRVEVLHAGHGEAVVVGVADYFKLNFFPAFQRLFYQNLFGESERTFGQLNEGFFVGADTTTKTTQSVSRTYHDRITDFTGSLQSIFHALYGVTLGRLHRYFVEFLHEEVTVFSVHDSLYRGTQHTYTVFFENALLIEFRTAVQRRLSTESQQNAIGTFLLDDFFHEIRSHRQEVNLIGDTFRSLDGSDVGVHQHGADTFFTQRFQRLRTGVIELSGLTDLERT